MNTDNMSIDGRTIDYGPYAFLDDYDTNYVCNHTDREGRYSFGNQPAVAHWNLQQLAKAISPIVNYEDALKVLNTFGPTFEKHFLSIMYKKLGLQTENDNDLDLLVALLEALESTPTDYTKFFRTLSHYDGNPDAILDLVIFKKPLQEWLEQYDTRLEKESLSTKQRQEMMLKVNPKYILKNHILQEAIEAATNRDYSMVDDLLTVALDPFSEHPTLEHLGKSAPKELKNIRLSCSS
jgi:uncharacterized protein YdiU (UPF0061 family)